MKFPAIEMTSEMFAIQGKELIGDASTMMNRHLQPLYDNSYELGFAVKSTRTDNVVVFVMTEEFYHGQGEDRELAGWKYKVTDDSVRKHPECKGCTATIFND
jgi:hypothetical protein